MPIEAFLTPALIVLGCFCGYVAGNRDGYKEAMTIMYGDYTKLMAPPIEEPKPIKKNPMGFLG